MPSDSKDTLLTAREAAKVLTVHEVTLAAWRLKDRGPPYRRLPGSDRIVYSHDDLIAWSKVGRVVPEMPEESARTFSCLAKRGNAERVEVESFISGVPMTQDDVVAVIKAAIKEALAEQRIA